MVFGLCPAGTEFYDFTKTSFELLRGYILKKYGSQSLARLLRLFLILTTVHLRTTTAVPDPTTTKRSMTLLEKVKKDGALSTWSMSKKDKLALLAKMSKAYLNKLSGRKKRSLGSTNLEQIIESYFDINPSLEDIVSDQSNIIPTCWQ